MMKMKNICNNNAYIQLKKLIKNKQIKYNQSKL